MFFYFFLIIDLCFLIPANIAQIFNPTVELAIPTGKATNEANAEIEAQPLTARIKKKNKKVFKIVQSPTHFLCFSPINSLCFFSFKI